MAEKRISTAAPNTTLQRGTPTPQDLLRVLDLTILSQARHAFGAENGKWYAVSHSIISSPMTYLLLVHDEQKCDGTKPACQQCVKAKKAECCEYDDGKGKTRTQLMREHIARLETRIKELESSDKTSPPVTLFDPHAASPYFSESSSSSSHDSPGVLTLSASASPIPFPVGTCYTFCYRSCLDPEPKMRKLHGRNGAT
jgi:hypothetical protein